MNQHADVKEHHSIDLAEASRLWKEGVSSALIAARFSVSRNAVLGYAHRNREHFPPQIKRDADRSSPAASPIRRPSRSLPEEEIIRRKNDRIERKALTDRARMEAVANDVLEFKTGTSRYLRTHPDDVARQVRGKLLVDLESHECRFAVNSGSPYLFCAESTNGGSWCSHHAMRVYSARKIA